MVLPPKEDWGNWWEVFVAAVIGGTVAFSEGGVGGGGGGAGLIPCNTKVVSSAHQRNFLPHLQ